MVSCALLAFLYGAEEAVISQMFCPFRYMQAPVQSISCLTNIRFPITIWQWAVGMTVLRMIAAALFAGIVCVAVFIANQQIMSRKA